MYRILNRIQFRLFYDLGQDPIRIWIGFLPGMFLACRVLYIMYIFFILFHSTILDCTVYTHQFHLFVNFIIYINSQLIPGWHSCQDVAKILARSCQNVRGSWQNFTGSCQDLIYFAKILQDLHIVWENSIIISILTDLVFLTDSYVFEGTVGM